MKHILTMLLLILSTSLFSQAEKKIEVLTLGSFHFEFRNRDVIKFDAPDQIDVLEAKHQKAIEEIAKRIARFKPTIIVIERDPDLQPKYDSLYIQYVNGIHQLSRGEDQQIGFRLAKMLNLKKVYCVNAWGQDYETLNKVLYGADSLEKKKFMATFSTYADTIKQYFPEPIFKTKGIREDLIQRNQAHHIKSDLGTYLLGIFKYETKDNQFFGPDFVTGWWFNRNLRIFRNIQKLSNNPDDRILVIYGSGHINLLNIFFESSPEYKLLKINDYLK